MPVPAEPEGFPYHQWYRLVRRRLPLAAEVTAGDPARRAWISVTPFRGHPSAVGSLRRAATTADGDGWFRVHYYEVDRDRYEEVYDSLDWDLLGAVHNRTFFDVQGAVNLMHLLHRWLDDLTRLKDPGLVGDPLF